MVACVCRQIAGGQLVVALEARPEDAGRYEVRASNAAGQARAGCDLVVLEPAPAAPVPPVPLAARVVMEPKAPRIQLPLKDLGIVEGASARLDCVIVGQPEPEVLLGGLWKVVGATAPVFGFVESCGR